MGVFDIVRETIRDRITAFALTFVSPFIPREQRRRRSREEENTVAESLGKFIEVSSVKTRSPGSYRAPLDSTQAPALPMTRVKSLLPGALPTTRVKSLLPGSHQSPQAPALPMTRVESSLP
jgi:hypothetical protein